jgi:hypothetical protein
MPLVSRTRATLRSAEFGFFGVVVRADAALLRGAPQRGRLGLRDRLSARLSNKLVDRGHTGDKLFRLEAKRRQPETGRDGGLYHTAF